MHPLDRKVVLVEGHEEDRPPGRHLEIGRAVLFHRHRPQDSFEVKRPQPGDKVRIVAETDRLRQILHDQQSLDFARLDSLQVAAVVDVGQDQRSGGPLPVDAGRNNRFTMARTDGTRIIDLALPMPRVEHPSITLGVHLVNLFSSDDKKGIVGKRIWVFDERPPIRQHPRHGQLVGPSLGRNNRRVTEVVGNAVTGGKRGENLLALGDRLGREHYGPRMHVAE